LTICGETTAVSLLAAVLDPATPLAGLETARLRARELVQRAEDVMQRAAAELLYQCSAAAAHFGYEVNIAAHLIDARRALLARLAMELGFHGRRDIAWYSECGDFLQSV
jgi:hypothetical protein